MSLLNKKEVIRWCYEPATKISLLNSGDTKKLKIAILGGASGAPMKIEIIEALELRESGEYLAFVRTQLENSLFHLSAEVMEQVVIAYEPIWAIGTGLTASVEQAEEMHAAIRSWLKETYSASTAEKISILYGGSCNPSNAKALFACPNVDGGLIGGAALKLADFSVLVAEETWITLN
jgi:triosephosphate isomerase